MRSLLSCQGEKRRALVLRKRVRVILRHAARGMAEPLLANLLWES